MYCPHCGAPGQNHRFCTSCGGALQPGGAPPQAAPPSVNVTVNVGPPVVVSPSPPSGLSRAVADAARAVVQARQDAARRREQLDALRAAVQRHLARCDALIEEIEGTIALDLLPYEAGVRERYVRALNVRQRVAEAHSRAVTLEDMAALNDRLQWALHELETTRHTLAAP